MSADTITHRSGKEIAGLYFDELNIGMAYETRGRTITESDLVMFSALTGDYYPMHTDVEYAKGTVFGERIAHGLLVVSYAAGLLPLEPGPIIAFYGIDKMRFLLPTRIGDTIRVRMELTGLDERGPDAGIATFSQIILNQRDEAVVKATVKVALKRRRQS